MLQSRISRRRVLKAGAAALALPAFAPRNVLGANEKIKVAVIGLGGRAGGVLIESRGIATNMEIVGVADCFAPRIGAFINAHGQGRNWKGYEDFRKMIEEQKPEGVMVETTTHARGWITIIAMQMGCDVYIEKPMCLTIAEGRAMVKAARRYGRITQVGTQQRSIALNNQASDFVKQGGIGKVHTVLAPNFVGAKRWSDKPAAPLPEGADARFWDIWTNQAVMRPYHRDLHYGWSMWWDYDGGGECFGVTGWGTHSYDQVNRGLGTDETGPVEIVLEEPVTVSNTGKFAKARARSEDTGTDYHGMARAVVGPRARITMKFAGGTELKCHLDGDSGPGLGAIFIGEKGSLEINRNEILGTPAELTKGMERTLPGEGGGTGLHVKNWLEGIESRKRCTADIEYGQRSTTLCYLVNIVRDVGKVGAKLLWDPVAERFTNCEEGNAFLDRERRKGYELPPLA
ncbi:MAG TPA: Gfo/Idh/MocA family oxidoreductase [Planctomycetota bacterium]|jgi:predicted dehydrogenase|nr:Gfo/Idh/MocA family oxidoreductase [Planctomycetota bacterium]OQC21576.1 MAG: putative oxidoreductase YcjS [Planctomycetes bacterium ADurb.Bin069]NMD36791.1 Gfo/Idh/MocA family oxidoreductase [Planctomycetota bacterium]HNR98558.1 Gfo/Idh/MocA family oxidoreductase [Planctomycetota bacterium]HOE28782.1 Gfo/Idh/MocA family oxidoreductase [Planctomycetota bacterium]